MGRVGDHQCNTVMVWDLQAVTWTMLLCWGQGRS